MNVRSSFYHYCKYMCNCASGKKPSNKSVEQSFESPVSPVDSLSEGWRFLHASLSWCHIIRFCPWVTNKWLRQWHSSDKTWDMTLPKEPLFYTFVGDSFTTSSSTWLLVLVVKRTSNKSVELRFESLVSPVDSLSEVWRLPHTSLSWCHVTSFCSWVTNKWLCQQHISNKAPDIMLPKEPLFYTFVRDSFYH